MLHRTVTVAAPPNDQPTRVLTREVECEPRIAGLPCKRLRIDSCDGSPVVEYRIENGCVERRVLQPGTATEWRLLTAEQLSSHVEGNTVVARWLTRRLGIAPLIRACNQEN
jgi:hypothetical protein